MSDNQRPSFPPPLTYQETVARLRERNPSEMLAIETLESTLSLFTMAKGFCIDAEMIHVLFQIKQPLGLWISGKLTHCKPYRDYVKTTEVEGAIGAGGHTSSKKNKWMLTIDTARVVCLGNNGKTGAVYSVLTTARLMHMRPGLDPIEFMREAQEHARENERLEALFDE